MPPTDNKVNDNALNWEREGTTREMKCQENEIGENSHSEHFEFYVLKEFSFEDDRQTVRNLKSVKGELNTGNKIQESSSVIETKSGSTI